MKQQPTKLDIVTHRLTRWIGSVSSLVTHTIVFVAVMISPLFGFSEEYVLLVLTTIVSLEAIYLAIFIQYTVNRHSETLEEVAEDIEDVAEDVEEVTKNVEEISEDVEELSEDVDEISEDVGELTENVEEISEDVEELSTGEQEKLDKSVIDDNARIENLIKQLLKEVENLRTRKIPPIK